MSIARPHRDQRQEGAAFQPIVDAFNELKQATQAYACFAERSLAEQGRLPQRICCRQVMGDHALMRQRSLTSATAHHLWIRKGSPWRGPIPWQPPGSS